MAALCPGCSFLLVVLPGGLLGPLEQGQFLPWWGKAPSQLPECLSSPVRLGTEAI